MTRFSGLLMLLLLFAGCGPALAQSQPAARYVFVPVEAGALRLDTGTGEVSLCAGADGAGTCTALAEAARAEQESLAPLRERIAALEARVAALEAPGKLADDDEAMDRVMLLAERMMRRFFGMVRDMREEFEREEL